MPNLFKKAIPFIVIALFLAMATILPELLGEDIKTWCESNLGPYCWAVIIAIFVLLFGLAAKYKPDLLGGLLPQANNDKASSKREDITHFYPTIRENLQSRYFNRLKQKLANRQPVNLRRLSSFIGSDEAISAYVTYNSEEIRETMGQTFQNANGRLLLVGAPGAGKTSLLLQLVLSLLETEKDALPALLNLATWSKEYPSLENWLKEILPNELGVNKALAQQILLDNRLILLFDGLDEVREDNRASCLEAIGRYGMDAQRRFVISSRIEEYKAVMKDAPVHLQVEVGPLTIEQVERELASMGHGQPETMRLYHALQKDQLLRQAAKTPFYLNTLQLLFASGKTLADLGFQTDTLEGRQQEIVDRFVAENLARPVEQARMPEDTGKWLAFWASRMEQRNLVVFELKDLQYDWWRWSKRQILIINGIAGFAHGLYLGTLILLYMSVLEIILLPFDSSVSGIKVGLWQFTFFITIGTIVSAYTGYKDNYIHLITTIDKTHWSIDIFARFFKEIITTCLFFAITIGLLLKFFDKIDEGIILTVFYAICLGLFIAVYSSLFQGVLDVLRNGFSNYLQISSPYQRFIASLKSLDFSILQHLHLRYLLYRRGLLPWRLVYFLNEMTERHLLESDGAEFDKSGRIVKSGATWRFRHRILQEHFAKQWVEPA